MKNSRRRSEVVVITGASAGLGRATARRFAREGARLALLARGLEGLEAAQREARAAGAEAIICPVDVADANQVEQAAAQVEEQLGPIDIWVNNAMTSVFSAFKEMTAEEFRRVTEVTYLGYVYGTMSALKRMLPRDHGCIVQVGSALAYRSIPLQSAYCGAKHAIRGFTDSIRSELIHDGSKVHITMVQMPALNTPQFRWVKSKLPRKAQPVPPIYQPEVGADAVYWAAHTRKREVFVGMSAVKAILGNKVIPGKLDEYLAEAGYEGQQMDEPRDRERPHNLWKPLSGDHGAHGDFDERARRFSPQLWANQHRDLLGVIGSGLAGLGMAWLFNRNGRRSSRRARRQRQHSLQAHVVRD